MPHRHNHRSLARAYKRFCILCGDPHPADAAQCPSCGREVRVNPLARPIRRCSVCHSEVPADARLCPHCCRPVTGLEAFAGYARLLMWLIPLPVVAAVITLALAQSN